MYTCCASELCSAGSYRPDIRNLIGHGVTLHIFLAFYIPIAYQNATILLTFRRGYLTTLVALFKARHLNIAMYML